MYVGVNKLRKGYRCVSVQYSDVVITSPVHAMYILIVLFVVFEDTLGFQERCSENGCNNFILQGNDSTRLHLIFWFFVFLNLSL